jgi:predicted nucleic acid-binding protein
LIALDTSSLVHYLAGSAGKDVDAVDVALAQSQACLPPVVLCEVLNDPKLPQRLEKALLQIPVLPLKPGYWERAGRLRALAISGGHKAKLADTLIAQACLDYEVPLVTRDPDFRHFRAAGLRVLPG